MKACLFTYTRQGVDTSLRVRDCLAPDWHCRIFAPERFSKGVVQPLYDSLEKIAGELWRQMDAFIFVSATGIAVRAIAPFIRDKAVDPAVVCVDVAGKYAISLLSGHIGGGNRLAKQIAQGIAALPVITTATDINRRFAVDEWAQRQGYEISSMEKAKEVSAAILEQDIPFTADTRVSGELPAGLYVADKGTLGILVSPFVRSPFDSTLRLIPKVLTVGIGCRKGATKNQIADAVGAVMESHQLDLRAVKGISSIDIKRQEEGLVAFCESFGHTLTCYSADALASLRGDFSSSAFVQSIAGVDNVCERAAMMTGGRMVVNKTAKAGVTVAVAEAEWEVRF